MAVLREYNIRRSSGTKIEVKRMFHGVCVCNIVILLLKEK